jgi:drug/metabolite transporter, DME family
LSGETYAVACAFLWALSSTLIKSQTGKMHIVTLGALRTIPALLIYWLSLILSDRLGQILQLPVRTWVFLIGSAIIGLVIGDLLYLASMKLIGLSRALPLSTTYPFFTIMLAVLFLNEQPGWAIGAGALLIGAGAYLLAVPKAAERAHEGVTPRANRAGTVMAILAALCWGAGTILARMGLEGIDVAIANAIRLSVLAIAFFAMSLRLDTIGQIRKHGLGSLGIIFAAGIIGAGLGTFAFLSAVQRAGAAKTSILTATTPLFGLPFSLVLKERLSVRKVAGTVLTVAGVWLTVL